MLSLGRVVLVVLLGSACSESKDGDHTGSGGSGTAAGAGGGGAGGSAGVMIGLGGGGSAGATLALNPPASVSLTACESVKDDPGSSTAYGDCIECCFAGNFTNGGWFEGSCACNVGIEDYDTCAAQAGVADQCQACCVASSYYGSATVPPPSPACVCREHQDDTLCKSYGNSVANCSVCCINAGYVSHAINGGCVCLDG